MTSTGKFNMIVTGLEPNTLYYFRAVADAGAYGNDFGETMLLKTLAVPLVLTTTGATGVTGGFAVLNGDLTEIGSAEEVILSFEYGKTDAYGTVTEPVTITHSGPFSKAVTGLQLTDQNPRPGK